MEFNKYLLTLLLGCGELDLPVIEKFSNVAENLDIDDALYCAVDEANEFPVEQRTGAILFSLFFQIQQEMEDQLGHFFENVDDELDMALYSFINKTDSFLLGEKLLLFAFIEKIKEREYFKNFIKKLEDAAYRELQKSALYFSFLDTSVEGVLSIIFEEEDLSSAAPLFIEEVFRIRDDLKEELELILRNFIKEVQGKVIKKEIK